MGVVRAAVARPAAARPGSRIPDPVRLLHHWRKLFWLSVAVALLAGGDMLLAKYGPDLTTETVETGASFSVSAGSFATESRAAVFASTLDASGLPILVHMRPDDRRYLVMVGPYVSTDEAERAQRKLAAWGLGDARLVVDDTMRSQPQQASIFGFGESASNSVVMVAASGVSSLVFEMHDLPKEVEAKRTSPTTIDLAIGRTSSSAAYEPLRLPEGVSLVRQLFVRSHGNGIHAHLVVPQDIESRLRLEGRRVYLDLAFPRAPWSIRREVAPAPKQDAEPSNVAPAPRPSVDPEALNAAFARFAQMEPFLTSAAESPEPEVLAALSHSLEDLRASVPAGTAAPELDAKRQTLLSAIAKASAGLAPAFAGDRRPAIAEAIAFAHSQ